MLNPISIIANRTAAGRPLRVGLRALGGRAVWPMAGGNGGGAPPRAAGGCGVTNMKYHSATFGPDARTGASRSAKGRVRRARGRHTPTVQYTAQPCRSSHAHREDLDYEVACNAWKQRLPAAPDQSVYDEPSRRSILASSLYSICPELSSSSISKHFLMSDLPATKPRATIALPNS